MSFTHLPIKAYAFIFYVPYLFIFMSLYLLYINLISSPIFHF